MTIPYACEREVGEGAREVVGCGPHTVRVILRPSVTSSGRTLRNSSITAWLDGSLPNVERIIGSTSFHSVIWTARMARQTHSCVRIGLEPVEYSFKYESSCERRPARDSRGMVAMS